MRERLPVKKMSAVTSVSTPNPQVKMRTIKLLRIWIDTTNAISVRKTKIMLINKSRVRVSV